MTPKEQAINKQKQVILHQIKKHLHNMRNNQQNEKPAYKIGKIYI